MTGVNRFAILICSLTSERDNAIVVTAGYRQSDILAAICYEVDALSISKG